MQWSIQDSNRTGSLDWRHFRESVMWLIENLRLVLARLQKIKSIKNQFKKKDSETSDLIVCH